MKRLFILILLFAWPMAAAAEDSSMHAFGEMPVLADGRLKPLDSLARVMLKRIHGGVFYDGKPAIQWLAELCFAPQDAVREPMFTVGAQPALMLGLPVRGAHLYRFDELAGTLQAHRSFLAGLAEKDKSSLTRDEAEVVRIYHAANDFAELIGSFSLLLPLNNAQDVREFLHLPDDAPVTYFDLEKYRRILDAEMERLSALKHSAYTPREEGVARAASRLVLQEALDQNNALVRVIPPVWGGEEWLSPWGVFSRSGGSPQSVALLRLWRDAGYAYRTQNEKGWNAAMEKLLAASRAALSPSEGWRLRLEYFYHRLNLLEAAALFYGLGLSLLAARFSKTGAVQDVLSKILLLTGLAAHAAALGMRMLILLRPPVSTLYESLVFVSFLVMAAGNWLGWRRRNHAGLLVGGITGLMVLMASEMFGGDSDTLGVLVAVLNTNFWLATHVVCITTGYSAALVTGSIAHLYLFRRAVQKIPENISTPLAVLLHRAALVALLFTAVGTMLGGIWADQSWGRFWGWDPKENGALLIVLWLIWLLHGRIADQLKPFAFAVGAALVNVIVALAWVGVNLLSVGLHSYGFTDAAATGLVAFCGAEFLFVALMALMQRFGMNQAQATTPI